MTRQFAVTYERWDEAAIEAGDTDDRGYIIEGVSLGDAIRLGLEAHDPKWLNTPEANEWPVRAPRWFTWYTWNDGTSGYFRTGVNEQRSLHIPEAITPASRRRIARLFGVRVRP